jgi:eukaryotic-like serine/threonine-protein kinase
MSVKRLSECDESQLELLLFGNDDSDAFRVAAEHIESCETCRQRLTELAGDNQSWCEARDLLREFDPNVQPSTQDVLKVKPNDRGELQDTHSPGPTQLDFLAAPSHPELLGRLGRYEVERVIGTGGMGIVLKGFDTELNRPVAIKVLSPHLAHSSAARQRFAREGRAAAAVVHEHVVAIHNVESEGDMPFLVMQYVAGESLQARVDRQGPLSVSEMLRIAIQAASGLAAAHEQGLVHRDIKPANLLLEAGVERALLTDFGLARAIDDASVTHTGVVAGTPHYMSPEQADGRPIDHRSDLFSLGSVLYFMATGQPPFCAERPMAVLNRVCHSRHQPVREINSNVPEDLVSMIDRLLDKRPQKRPANAAEVQQTLMRLLSDIQQGGIGNRSSRRKRMKQRVVLAVALGGLAILSTNRILDWLGRPDAIPPATRVNPPVTLPAPHRTAGDLMTALLSFGPSNESEFAATAATVAADVDRLESDTPGNNAFLQNTTSSWSFGHASVSQDLQNLESVPFPDFAEQGDRQ